MLEDLKILNGSISPKFSPNILNYEVKVDSTVFSLDLKYKTKDDNTITIYGNDYLTEGEGHVLIEVYDGSVTTYTIKVIKEHAKASKLNDDSQKVEVSIKDNVLNDVTTPLIASVCFIFILVIFCLLFGKKKKQHM